MTADRANVLGSLASARRSGFHNDDRMRFEYQPALGSVLKTKKGPAAPCRTQKHPATKIEQALQCSSSAERSKHTNQKPCELPYEFNHDCRPMHECMGRGRHGRGRGPGPLSPPSPWMTKHPPRERYPPPAVGFHHSSGGPRSRALQRVSGKRESKSI